MLSVQPESLASGFLASIRQSLPETAVVREALSFIRLVIDHPSPPREIAALRKTLWDLIHVDPADPLKAADRLRRAGHQALRLTNHSTSGQILELGLLTLSLRFDDRPAHRMLAVDIGMMAAGMEVVGIEDVVPEWRTDGSPTSFMSEGIVRPWIESQVAAVSRQCAEEINKTSNAFARWNASDFECALLAIRMGYCIFRRPIDAEKGGAGALSHDFDQVGEPTWSCLERALRSCNGRGMTAPSLTVATWHQQSRRMVRAAIQGDRKAVAWRTLPQSFQAPKEPDGVVPPATARPPAEMARPAANPEADGCPTLIVCRNPIVDATDKYDKDEVSRHRILEKPLPLARMPHPDDVRWMREELGKEFPWADSVLETIFGDLLGRARLGVQVLAMPPTLLVGPAGSGKSRLARRIAEELNVPRIDLALGGTSDTKVLGGTSRGWGTFRQYHLLVCADTPCLIDHHLQRHPM
jgi:hypothetical protein